MADSQEGTDVIVYMLERNFDTGLAEIRRGSWTPGGGIHRGVSFGSYSAAFGGTLGAHPRGAVVDGLSDDRAPDIRVVTKQGLAAFPNGEVAFTCEGTLGTYLSVYLDGGLTVFKSADEHCGPLQCNHLLGVSPQVDGGRICFLNDLNYDDVGDSRSRVWFDVHPAVRIVGIANYPFVEFDAQGRTLRYAKSGGDSGVELTSSPFWPNDVRVPTRVKNEFATKYPEYEDVTGVPYYYSWIDGGIERSPTPFAKYMTRVTRITALPTGVVVEGLRGTGQKPKASEWVGVLLDPTGETVLGTFRRTLDGDECVPNAFVEGRYFNLRTILGVRWEVDDRFHAELLTIECDFVPIQP